MWEVRIAINGQENNNTIFKQSPGKRQIERNWKILGKRSEYRPMGSERKAKKNRLYAVCSRKPMLNSGDRKGNLYMQDVYSGNGLNFLGEKNYIVTTMECYKKLIPDLNGGKFTNHMLQCNPDSSHHYGILVAVPYFRELEEEFENPTPIDADQRWRLKSVRKCITGPRKKSMTELLFCMLRSGSRGL